MMPKRTEAASHEGARRRSRPFANEEAQGLLDADETRERAVERVEQSGIVFIDEIDKVAARQAAAEAARGPTSRARACSATCSRSSRGRACRPSTASCAPITSCSSRPGRSTSRSRRTLIPELQGRFPIRVELSSLGREDLVRILSEPDNSLVRQYTRAARNREHEARIHAGGHRRDRRDRGGRQFESTDDIGARRLHTVMERLLDDVSFDAPDWPDQDDRDRRRVRSRAPGGSRRGPRPVAVHLVGVSRRREARVRPDFSLRAGSLSGEGGVMAETPGRILVCDDENFFREAIRDILMGEALEVVEAFDGEAALELAEAIRVSASPSSTSACPESTASRCCAGCARRGPSCA